jgi:hypothetical protein
VGTVSVAHQRDVLDSVTVDGAGLTGKIVLTKTTDRLALLVDLVGEGSSEVTVDIADSGLVFDGLDFDGDGIPATSRSARFAADRFSISNDGRQAFSVFLERAETRPDPELRVVVSADGNVVYTGVLRG